MNLSEIWRKANENHRAIEESIINLINNDPKIDKCARKIRKLVREWHPDDEGVQFQRLARMAIQIIKEVERTLISKFVR